MTNVVVPVAQKPFPSQYVVFLRIGLIQLKKCLPISRRNTVWGLACYYCFFAVLSLYSDKLRLEASILQGGLLGTPCTGCNLYNLCVSFFLSYPVAVRSDPGWFSWLSAVSVILSESECEGVPWNPPVPWQYLAVRSLHVCKILILHVHTFLHTVGKTKCYLGTIRIKMFFSKHQIFVLKWLWYINIIIFSCSEVISLSITWLSSSAQLSFFQLVGIINKQ